VISPRFRNSLSGYVRVFGYILVQINTPYVPFLFSLQEWNSLDLSHLEALCFRRGLPISPEPTVNNLTSQETHTNSETEDGKKKKDSTSPIVSYGSMRQLLIKRLVEREAYWRNRQILNVISSYKYHEFNFFYIGQSVSYLSPSS
jgi:hypothetical protein